MNRKSFLLKKPGSEKSLSNQKKEINYSLLSETGNIPPDLPYAPNCQNVCRL